MMLTLGDLGERLLEKDNLVILMIGTGVVLIVLFRTVGSVIKATAREKTRREIAAFIAEGSMTPEQGERLMKSGNEPTA